MQHKTLAEMEDLYTQGRVSSIMFEAYCWLWRNSAYRLSSAYQYLEGQPIPDGCYDLIKPYLHIVLVGHFQEENNA